MRSLLKNCLGYIPKTCLTVLSGIHTDLFVFMEYLYKMVILVRGSVYNNIIVWKMIDR